MTCIVKKERVSPYDFIKKTMSFLTQENDSKGVYIDEILSGNSSLGSLSSSVRHFPKPRGALPGTGPHPTLAGASEAWKRPRYLFPSIFADPVNNRNKKENGTCPSMWWRSLLNDNLAFRKYLCLGLSFEDVIFMAILLF